MGLTTSANIPDELSQRQSMSERRTRRLRYKRHREGPNWESNPPDGSDVTCDKYSVKQCTRELLQNCKSFPKLRFPEIHGKKKLINEVAQSEKETVLQKLRRQFKEEAEAEEEWTKLLKKQRKSLAKLEKKWRKACESKSKKSKKSELPGWFKEFLKDTHGVVSLGPLFTPSTTDEHTSTEFDKLTTRKIRLLIRTQKSKQGDSFKVSEKYAINRGKSWKTNVQFKGVSISSSDNSRVCLTGDFESQDKKVSFDLMVINKKCQTADRKLGGAYSRQTSGEDMITWLVNCDQ